MCSSVPSSVKLNNMSKPATIKDIARELNLSTSTVSRALNDRWDINRETRDKVLEAAKKLNYKPNLMSLGLKRSQTYTIGVIIPEFVNSFFAEVINGINSVLQNQNYQLLICQSNESWEAEQNNIRFLESRYVDGYLVSVSHDAANREYYSGLLEKGTPLVFFNRICEGVAAPRVIVDDHKWAYEATEHLIRQGCRRIAHLKGPDNLSVTTHRLSGYLDAIKSYGLPMDDSLVVPSGIFLKDGEAAAARILQMPERPDGIFAVNDPAAIGAMRILKRNGVRIPEDMAVVGFSESPMATVIEPNLSSVAQPTFEIGASAARLILEWIQSERIPRTGQIILDATLNIRESSLRSGLKR